MWNENAAKVPEATLQRSESVRTFFGDTQSPPHQASPDRCRRLRCPNVVISNYFKGADMKKNSPLPTENVPETDATYERTRAQTSTTPTGSSQPSSADVRKTPLPAGGTIEGNMKTEEPDGWDQAPQEAQKPQNKRHSRPDGIGGSDPKSSKDRTGAAKGEVSRDGTVNTGF
jgi:hypothetical protein